MSGSKLNLLEIFFGDKRQYEIPFYQRNYAWNKENCLRFFNNVLNSEKGEFLGIIIQTQLKEDEYGINKYRIIDGQQRITTIYLFLKALFDVIDKTTNLHEELTKKLFNNTQNKEETKDDKIKLKLLLKDSDNEEFLKLMKNDFSKVDKSSNIWNNYDFFKELISNKIKSKANHEEIFKRIEQIKIVKIDIDEQKEDAQKIYETINSTGKSLTPVDLIRNYLLMQERNSKKLYDDYWKPFENLFNDNTNNDNFNIKIEDFFKVYMYYKSPDYAGTDTYNQFKKLIEKQEGKSSKEEVMKEILDLAHYYKFFMTSKIDNIKSIIPENLTPDKNTTVLLNGYASFQQDSIYPFLFHIFNDYRENKIDLNQLNNVIHFFLNYTMRRYICGFPSKSLIKMYSLLYSEIFHKKEKKEVYLDAIYNHMLSLRTSDSVPLDKVVEEKLKTANIYRNPKACKSILTVIENGLGKNRERETVNVDDDISIEHVMPQNNNNIWWKEEIERNGSNYDFVYDKYLNTLGNLTLTSQSKNKDASDKPFPQKKEILKKDTKFLTLSGEILNKDHWDEDSITKRTTSLTQKLLIELKLPKIFYEKSKYKESSTHYITEKASYEHQKPVSFTLLGATKKVNSWKELLMEVLKILYGMDKSKMFTLAKNNYKSSTATHEKISFDPTLYTTPIEIEHSGIYIEANRGSTDMISTIRFFLSLYDIQNEDFVFDLTKTGSKN